MVTGKRIVAAGLFALALTGAGAAAQTQPQPQPQTQTAPQGTIGNPQLKNFELPGTTTVPAPQPPATTAPPPATTAPPPAAEPEAAPPPADTVPAEPEARAPERRPPPRAAAPVAPAVEAAPAPAEPVVPAPADLQQVLPPPAAPLPAPAPQLQTAPSAPAPEPAGFPWHYLLIAALVGLLAFAAYRKMKGSPEEQVEYRAEAEPAPEPAPQPLPQPAPAPEPAPQAQPQPQPQAPAGLVGIQLRPWLELEFRPDRAAATLTDASVQFELIVRNRGNAPARNVRIESAIFNAGPDQEREIAAFYAEPIRERTAPGIALIPPREELRIRSAVTMPKELVREINVQGRLLFIPTVAFNVVYEWGANKTGQTSMAYVVGREAETPTEKMGAFRLDLGPRLYRSVGQRQTKLAVIS